MRRLSQMMGRGSAPLVLLVALTASGCATGGLNRPEANMLSPHDPLASQTLEDRDAWPRHFLAQAKYDSALYVVSDSSPVKLDDELQRALQNAAVLHYAGEYERSNAAFEWAEREADLRYTKSVSKALASMLVNDEALDWTPIEVHLALIPYFRMKNYLALDDLDGAMVEARKLNNYLAEVSSSGGDGCTTGGGFLEYLTGMMFESGGDDSEAIVPYRLADKIFASCESVYGFGAPSVFGADLYETARAVGFSEVADQAVEKYGLPKQKVSGETGELVVLIENGFVAHRKEQALHIPIFSHEAAQLQSKNPLVVATTAFALSGRVINNLMEQQAWGVAYDDLIEVQVAQALSDAHILKLAWPVYRLEASRAAGVRVLVGDQVVPANVIGDVSAAVTRDFEEERKQVLMKSVARALLKYALAREVESQAEARGGFLAGFVAGKLANAAANAMESADTRDWTLLPDQITLAKVDLPVGEHQVRLEVLDDAGGVIETRDLGMVNVKAGGHTFLSQRVWGTDFGQPDRLTRALAGVEYAPLKEPTEEDLEDSEAEATSSN